MTYALPIPAPALVVAAKAAVRTVTAKLWVDWDGDGVFTDESAYVTEMRGIEAADTQTRYLSASEVVIELDNSTGRYGADNQSSPIYAYLTRTGQKAYVELGYNGVVARIGTYWIEKLDTATTRKEATMRLLDRVGQLGDVRISLAPDANKLTSAVFVSMCAAAGLAASEYGYDTGTRTVAYVVAGAERAIGELMQLAQAEGGRIFVDGNGVLQFWNAEHHVAALRTPLITLTRSAHVYDIAYPRRNEDTITRFVLEYDTRESVAVDEIVYDQKQNIVLAAPGLDAAGKVIFAAPLTLELRAMDMTRWERYLPVQFTTVNTLTAKAGSDGSGATLANVAAAPPRNGTVSPGSNLYYTWTASGPTGVLKLWTDSVTGAAVTVLRLNGKPQRSVAPYSVVADDPTADPARAPVEQKMTNAYLPSTDVAAEQAATELFFRSGQLATVNLPDIDGMPFLRAFDCLAIDDDSQSPTVRYFLQVLRNEWRVSESDGYRCALTTAPALPTNEQVVSQVIPTPSPGAPVTGGNQVPPWYWGPTASQVLVWTYSDWG
ncbi:MAG: hypothetical protein C0498_01295 [Anaerolinea sp.]|nr:hypothetical protein [Anaerolinea sp.]